MVDRIISKEELAPLAREILILLRDHTEREAAVLALSGELGSGKTTFTQALARELGVTEDITSPTFVIEKRYATKDPQFSLLVHIDAYRINETRELSVLGFSETLRYPHSLIVIEWPERVEELVPKEALRLHFSHDSETNRRISYG
jgi:tRNA threonylcarbamoyladenosine biosynthesis protein TsaE